MVSYTSQQPVGRVTPGLREAGLIEYVGGDAALADVLVPALSSAGFRLRQVATPSGNADGLILAHGLTGTALDAHAGALEALSAQARRLEAEGGSVIILQDTGGRFQPGDDRAWRGGLTGLARTATHEFPKALIRAIDIDIADLGAKAASDRLVEELLSGGAALCAGLSGRGRVVPGDTPYRLPAAQPGQAGPQDVFLVTGGARGVTADCIIELARRTQARFALLGRSAITQWPDDLEPTEDEKALRGALAMRAKANGDKIAPAALNREVRALLSGAEIRKTLAAIEQAGGKALYIPTDIADPAALREALAHVHRDLGRVTGLVHGAGVLADKLIREKTRAQVETVFAPKISGLEALLSELDISTLKTVVFFSSVAARYGNTGQADYAMANEILNRMAHWLKATNPQAAITSLGWGPWDGGMVTDSLKAKFAEMGVSLIPRDAGARLFADAVLAGSACPAELVIGSEIAHG
ncbi:SDR family NAD(P)-dependent oxidoreductase [Henriciella sp.]|uniref:SDR family NAD(P)-dependent oxidoreductase n=1 Tax=Henriciella sp. TaxID=1968823 RepID=UPI00260362C1|nr:SDR family NAD(P)-dependent oxidoreductase [Henriciella sp.]